MTLYEPAVYASGEGKAFWIAQAQLNVKVAAEDTAGAYSLLELAAPEGMGIAPHTHTREDETFVVVSGSFRLFCDGRWFELEQGDCAFLPRGLAHGFEVTSAGFRAMQIVNPGGFERMLEDLGDISARPRPAASLTPEDVARVMKITQAYGQIMSPPPSAGRPSGPRPGAAVGAG